MMQCFDDGNEFEQNSMKLNCSINAFISPIAKELKEPIESLETLKNQDYSLSRAAKMQRCEFLISEIRSTMETIKNLEYYCAL